MLKVLAGNDSKPPAKSWLNANAKPLARSSTTYIQNPNVGSYSVLMTSWPISCKKSCCHPTSHGDSQSAYLLRLSYGIGRCIRQWLTNDGLGGIPNHAIGSVDSL